MNVKLKYTLFIVIAIVFTAVMAWNHINKPNADLSGKKPEVMYSFTELMNLGIQDTAQSNKMIDQFIAVTGIIKSIVVDTSSTTIELGDSSSMSSIICQIDQRHKDGFATIKEGESVSIKGKVTAFTTDTILGLGNTIEMNFCSLNK